MRIVGPCELLDQGDDNRAGLDVLFSRVALLIYNAIHGEQDDMPPPDVKKPDTWGSGAERVGPASSAASSAFRREKPMSRRPVGVKPGEGPVSPRSDKGCTCRVP